MKVYEKKLNICKVNIRIDLRRQHDLNFPFVIYGQDTETYKDQ